MRRLHADREEKHDPCGQIGIVKGLTGNSERDALLDLARIEKLPDDERVAAAHVGEHFGETGPVGLGAGRRVLERVLPPCRPQLTCPLLIPRFE